MRILFDENTSLALAAKLLGHACDSVIQLGWRGIKNGALLGRAETAGFDVLMTLDDDMEPEQNMTGRRIAIIVLKPKKQGKEATLALADKIMRVLPLLRPGEIRIIRHDD